MKKLLICLLTGITVLAGYGTTRASVQSEIEKAGKDGKNVFLVVTEPGVAGTDRILYIANQAHKSVAESTVIEMNRTDSANSELVAKYRLTGAPLPMVLLIASNGLPAGSLTSAQASPEKLAKMIPSPKKQEVMQALNQNKTAFVVASRKTMAGRARVFKTCKAACNQMKDKAVFISVDMDDKQELSFLKKLRVNMSSPMPVTCVVNPRGQITGIFNGPVNSARLIQASANKPGGCCGGNKRCNLPAKKGKQK